MNKHYPTLKLSLIPKPESLPAPDATGLSEEVIKKVALRFLRQYYKFRLRNDDQPVTAKYDLEGVGGIVADGYYSFKKTDGKSFTATFEATSKTKQDEVLFKPQYRVIFWDGLAIACLVALVFTAINFFRNFHDLDERVLVFRLIIMVALMLASMCIFYLIAKNFRRYKYIYAVEQFKRYHADEQWVAISSDVFGVAGDAPDSWAKQQKKRFQELKDQCVLNGFGLLKIDPDLDTKILVTPSRQDIFMGKRKQVNFLSQEAAGQLQRQSDFSLRSLLPGFFHKNKTTDRFQKSFNNQMFIAAGSLLLTFFLLSKEMQQAGFQSVEPLEFRDELAISQSNELPEQREVVGDSLVAGPSNSIEKEDFEKNLWESRRKDLPQKDGATDTQGGPAQSLRKDTTEIFINGDKDRAIAYDCSRFYNFDSKKYIIEEGEYKDWLSAKRRLETLRKNNFESAALLLSCFTEEEGYVIYLGLIYNSAEEASQKIEEMRSLQQKVLKNVESLRIRPLPPVKR